MKHNNKKNQRRIRALQRRESDLEFLENKNYQVAGDKGRVRAEIAILKQRIV